MKNWGGKRKGAGRKPETISEMTVDRIVKIFKKAGKIAKSTPEKELAALAFKSKNEATRLKALEVYFKITTIQKIHQITEEKPCGPTICLPPITGSKEEEMLFRKRGYYKDPNFGPPEDVEIH